jgi:Ca2+-binding EF-hand superfamily protein
MKSRLLIAGTVAALLPIAGAFAQSSAPPESTQPAQQQGATFESLDKDSDGRISKTEAAANANVSAQFSRYDKNGNGFIEKDEVTVANTSPDPAKQ